VRKNFLNLNVADIGAKKRFNHVLRRICQGKCVLSLITELMLVRKNFFDPFFYVLKKFLRPEKKFFLAFSQISMVF
jgi:hypothetical protein